MGRWREWARVLKREAMTLYYVARDPRTPLVAKVLAALVVGYAFSPIDLIPDFIPILGYLDDLLLLPLGIWLVIRLVPAAVLQDCRRHAARSDERPTSRVAAAVILLVWVGAAALCGWLLYTYG